MYSKRKIKCAMRRKIAYQWPSYMVAKARLYGL
jgi:hypothetical protein